MPKATRRPARKRRKRTLPKGYTKKRKKKG